MSSFLAELKRRNVFKVAVVYAITSWLILQVSDVAFPALGLPEWAITLVMVLLIIGLILALILAWAFEMTPEGIKREADVDRSQSITTATGRRLNLFVVALLVAALGVSLYFNVVQQGSDEPVVEEPTGESQKSIAVLPFVNMSGDANNEYFSDGLTDTLLHMLSQVDELKVAARTSSFAFKGKNQDIRSIGQQLGVGSILEGSVQKSGNRLRIIAQLIDTNDGTHIWSDTFDRRNEDIFDVHDEIATKVVVALRVSLLGEQEQRLTKRHTENLEAYDQYIQGQQRVARRTGPGILDALAHYQKAVELDPDYALAWVGVADAAMLASTYDAMANEDALTIAKPAVMMALGLDDQLGEAYISRAALQDYMTSRDDIDTEKDYLRGIALSPNYARAYHWYANSLSAFERHNEALEYALKAAELDPLSPIIIDNVADVYFDLGQFDDSLRIANRVIDLDPGFSPAYRTKARVHNYRYGNFIEGARDLQDAWQSDRARDLNASSVCKFWIHLEEPGHAEPWCKSVKEISNNPGIGFGADLVHMVASGDLKNLKAIDDTQIEQMTFPPARYLILRLIRDQLILARDYAGARALYDKYMPASFMGNDPVVTIDEVPAAIDYGLLMINAGRFDRAKLYLDKAAAIIKKNHPYGDYGLGFAEAELYAVRGKNELAISALQRLIDDDVRWLWWYLERNQSLVTLHDDNRFVIMLNMLRAEIQKQRRQIIEEDLLLSPGPDTQTEN